MPVTFANSSTVTVKSTDGRWYEVRIVPDDGHRAWPRTLFVGRVAFVFGTLFAIYRLILRSWYSVRRSTKKRVEVIPWGTEGLPAPDRARPLIRELLPDDTAARVRATEIHAAISRGELPRERTTS